ncbi:MAG: enoyl-CoA hydratase-related protein, partial [Myxococcota bacterium]|nr:enoyl-CoA hydratase-related protein [Myxococcota bacterium]
MSQEQKNAAVEMSFNAENNIATLTLRMEGRANKINEAFGVGLLEAMEWAHSLEGLEGIIITSGHKDFCVGADIDSMFVERDAAKVLESTTKLNALFNKIETSKQPVVVALNGSALGGGFELALACHRRIALDNPKAKFGLPEVTLGLIPGAGGTQRLPRLVGIQTALDFILQGKMVRPSKALQAKLVDDIAESEEQLIEKSIAWIKENKRFKQPWLKSDYTWPAPQPGSEDARNMILAACGMLFKKTAGCYPAHEAATCAVQEGSLLRFDRALEVEGRYFAGLAVSDQAKDMIRTIWYHRTAAEKHEGLPTAENDEIQKVGILGAGMMGAGLAFICAQAGYSVVLKDIKEDALELGMDHCRSQLKKMKWLSDDEKNAILDRITPSL